MEPADCVEIHSCGKSGITIDKIGGRDGKGGEGDH